MEKLSSVESKPRVSFWAVAELRELEAAQIANGGSEIFRKELQYARNLGPDWRWYDISAKTAIETPPAIVHILDPDWPSMKFTTIRIISGVTLLELLKQQKDLRNISDFLIVQVPHPELKEEGKFRSIFVKKPKRLFGLF